jgi:hypothetical protein
VKFLLKKSSDVNPQEYKMKEKYCQGTARYIVILLLFLEQFCWPFTPQHWAANGYEFLLYLLYDYMSCYKDS